LPRPTSVPTHPSTIGTPRPPAEPVPPTSPPPTTTPAAPPPKPKPTPVPRGRALPLGYNTGLATRVITVVASSTGSTTALLQAWTKAAGGGWLKYGSVVTAHVGADGLSAHPSESRSATPIGSFTLTQAFGALANPGTSLPYFKTDYNDWWISQRGPLYNTHQHCASGCAFTRGDPNEHLRAITPLYNYAVVIDYNRSPVRQGAGSAFFLHVTDGSATAGCVAIGQTKLVALMKWLAPSTRPRILIGVA
jgi:L,D-peptidoglycan transpeptidase YkuD (ErfK/YbiS/YcfS/YnhG family)